MKSRMRRPSAVAMRSWVCSLVLIGAVSACTTTISPSPLPLLTQASPATICMFGRFGGTLAVDPVSGLGLVDSGRVIHVRWPFGYAARADGGSVLLIDAKGQVLARTGDQVAIGGGYVDGAIVACPGLAASSFPVP